LTRDRDPAGRPRNARPRDALGRPLPRAASPDAGQPRIPDDLALTGHDAARLADQLLRAGRPFHAHEVLEASWKTGPQQERDLWQGLAQAAVGLTHAHRGNARGAVALLRRGAARVRGYHARAEPEPGHPDPAQARSEPGHPDPAQAGTLPGHPDPAKAGTLPGHPDPARAGTLPGHPDPARAEPEPGHPDPARAGTLPGHARPDQGAPTPASDRDYPYGIDIAAFLAACDRLATRIEHDGLPSITPADLSPGLLRAGPGENAGQAQAP
jgi:hypothetical protein